MIRPTLLTFALLGASLLAQAPPPPPDAMRGPGPEGPHHRGGEFNLKFLGLSPDQDKAVKALLDQHRAVAQALHKAAAGQEEALHAAMEDPATSEPQLRALHAAASEARLKALLDHRALLLDLQALLTPEQRAKARRVMANQRREREARQALQEDLGEPGDGPHGPMPPPPPPRP